MSADVTHYELLGVEPDAVKDDIRSAYQGKLANVREGREKEQRARRPSDDVIRASRDEEARLRSAWQVLSDPVQRDRYDAKIGVNGDGDAELVDEDEADDEPEDEEPDERLPARAARGGQSLVTADGLEVPTTGRRATAAVIDLITMIAIYAVVTNIVAAVAGVKTGIPAVVAEVLTAEFLLVVYVMIPTMRSGQTLGKKYTYCMVVDRATGSLPTSGQVVRRYFVPAVAFVTLPVLGSTGPLIAAFYGLSFLMQREQVSLADRWAKTVVVIARYRPSPAG